MSLVRVVPLLVLTATVSVQPQRLAAQRPAYPAARRDPIVDVMHGERVADPYRRLEDLESDDTRAWIKAQDELTRRVVNVDTYEAYRARIDRLSNIRRFTSPLRRNNRWFFFETDANGLSGRVLMVREGLTSTPRALVDLRAEGPDRLSRVLSPSPDGSMVAYAETVDSSRWMRLKLIDTATGKTSGDALDRLHSSMGSVAWTADGRAFYYIRFDAPEGPRATAPVRGAAVMRHRLGTDQSLDTRVFQLDDAPNRVYAVTVTDDGQWLVVTTGIGAATEQQVFVQSLAHGGELVDLFRGMKGQFVLLGSAQGRLWFQTTVDASRGRVVSVDPSRPQPSNWVTVVPEPPDGDTLQYADLIGDRLIVMVTHDAAPSVRIHALNGLLEREVPLPTLGTVWGPSAGGQGFVGRTTDDEAYYSLTGVADPGSVYRLDPRTGESTLFLRPAFAFDPSDFTGTQVFYRSQDGTRIPMWIAHHKDVRADAARPALLYGYGALKWPAFPWFQPQILAWMESGGVYAVPGLRGGGEYGDRWHLAAIREKKQTSVDDYLAAAEWLVASKYAAAGKVVANGGSISGAVAAAAVVQRPALFGAAIIDIPALDLLRYDRHSGAASWIPEFGSTASPVEFAALRRLSPYHNLDSSVCYPPVLVLAGEKDDIAVPSHAYKFVAALQHAQRCDNPALLQVAWGAGHTFGTSNESSAETWARQLAFLSPIVGLDPARASRTASVLPEVRRIGRGETTMVMIPCMSCRWTSWEPFMRRNADRWRMYAVTLPGFGGTRVPEVPRDTDDPAWHENAVAAVTRLLEEERLVDVVLVGHSFGSAIAVQVAARSPTRVRALVNVDGGITSSRQWFQEDAGARVRAARALTMRNLQQYDDAGAWRAFNGAGSLMGDRQLAHHGMFMATPRDVVFQYWRENLVRDLNPLIGGLAMPVLDVKAIPTSDETPQRTRDAHLRTLQEAGAGANVQTVFFHDTGHFVHEQRPQLLEDTMVRFLAGERVRDARPAPTQVSVPGRFGHVETRGTGRVPLILMPCLGCDWRAFDEFMARHEATYRMYAVTWPGMGDTPIPRGGSGSDTPLADNVVAATVRLIERETLERPIVVAHSAAGPVAIKLASEHAPLIGGVIAVDATIQNNVTLGFSDAQRRDWADAELAAVLRQYDDDDAWKKLNTVSVTMTPSPARNAMYESMWRRPPRAHVLRYWYEWLRLDAGRLLPSLTVPVLALFALPEKGAGAERMRASVLDQFARNRPSSHVRVEFIQPGTHALWETAPQAFDAAVARFVSFARPRDDRPPRR